MNKELEALSRIEDCLYEDPYTDRNDVSYENDIATIKQALLKAQEMEKVLKIIAKKVVDVNYLLLISTGDVEDYNKHVYEINKVSQIDYCKLTKEEFELLKRWLNENGAR